MAARIRLADEGDAAAIAAIYRPVVEETAISFETIAPDPHEIARRVADTLRTYPWLVCDREGHIAGYAYASKHRVRAAYQWSVDTSVYVDSRDRRLGIGRALYLSLFAILAEQGYFNAFAGIALPNPGSVALHEAMGFEKLGVYRNVGFKLGEWRDVGWWQLSLKEMEAAPSDPIDLATVRQLPTWERLLACGESAIHAHRAA
jgi:L-amino acid N-acyltransferase YncA